MGRPLLIPALALIAPLAACSSAGPPALNAVGLGVAGRTDGGGARAGMTFGYWNTGYRGWGSFAKMRVDAVTGLDFLFDDPNQQDRYVGDDPYVDDHVGAFVFDVGLAYRFAPYVAAYGGVGLGNLYDYDDRVDPYGHHDAVVTTLDWGANLTTGLIMLIGDSGTGVDFGYDSFDESWRIGLVVNYGGSGDDDWFD